MLVLGDIGRDGVDNVFLLTPKGWRRESKTSAMLSAVSAITSELLPIIGPFRGLKIWLFDRFGFVANHKIHTS